MSYAERIPLRIAVPLAEQAAPAQRWSDPSVKRFHGYLEALVGHLDPESDAASLGRQLMDDLEAFDCALPRGTW